MPDNVLFVSHREQQCGVYQFGRQIGRALEHSTIYKFIYAECSTQADLDRYVDEYAPVCTIYNYAGDTLPWLTNWTTLGYRTPQIGIIHEITQEVADAANSYFFDFHIAADPTLILKNSLVYKTGRLLLRSAIEPKHNDIPVIGSFGFGTPGKNFDRLVQTVCDEFDRAVIRLNIPFAEFGDREGVGARKAAAECVAIANRYPNIQLVCTHDFLNERQVLEFLSANTLNAFLYSDHRGARGISSVIDLALSVRVPLAISDNSSMFRHIQGASPSIVVSERNRLGNIIANGTRPLERFYEEWTDANLVWDYERIVRDTVQRLRGGKPPALAKKMRGFVKRKLRGSVNTNISNSWAASVQDYRDNAVQHDPAARFAVAEMPTGALVYNRILNDEARVLYRPAIEAMQRLIPLWMKRKVERANVQQAFVLDTTVRLSRGIAKPRMLSVGCFEDTAWGALQILGYDTEGIDPVLNYDLDVYLTKPSTTLGSFDVVFSTSVIEHVEDDLAFLKNMSLLAKEGGYVVFTCDFKEGYQAGDPKPDCDHRFYTQDYLRGLVARIDDCELVDTPAWDCPNPDFVWGAYQYTFAAVVLRKTRP